MNIKKVNLQEKFDSFDEYWTPKVVGELNNQMVKLAKLKGEFVMHKHDQEDELFLVTKGVLKIEFEEQTVEVHPGEFVIVPRGVEHKPIADDEVEVMLFEPATTLNTGDQVNSMTVEKPERI